MQEMLAKQFIQQKWGSEYLKVICDYLLLDCKGLYLHDLGLGLSRSQVVFK